MPASTHILDFWFFGHTQWSVLLEVDKKDKKRFAILKVAIIYYFEVMFRFLINNIYAWIRRYNLGHHLLFVFGELLCGEKRAA
jgi:hypothetical protein